MMDIKKLGLISGVTMLAITATLGGCDNAAKDSANAAKNSANAAKKAAEGSAKVPEDTEKAKIAENADSTKGIFTDEVNKAQQETNQNKKVDSTPDFWDELNKLDTVIAQKAKIAEDAEKEKIAENADSTKGIFTDEVNKAQQETNQNKKVDSTPDFWDELNKLDTVIAQKAKIAEDAEKAKIAENADSTKGIFTDEVNKAQQETNQNKKVDSTPDFWDELNKLDTVIAQKAKIAEDAEKEKIAENADSTKGIFTDEVNKAQQETNQNKKVDSTPDFWDELNKLDTVIAQKAKIAEDAEKAKIAENADSTKGIFTDEVNKAQQETNQNKKVDSTPDFWDELNKLDTVIAQKAKIAEDAEKAKIAENADSTKGIFTDEVNKAQQETNQNKKVDSTPDFWDELNKLDTVIAQKAKIAEDAEKEKIAENADSTKGIFTDEVNKAQQETNQNKKVDSTPDFWDELNKLDTVIAQKAKIAEDAEKAKIAENADSTKGIFTDEVNKAQQETNQNKKVDSTPDFWDELDTLIK